MAEVSEEPEVQAARQAYEEARKLQRIYLEASDDE